MLVHQHRPHPSRSRISACRASLQRSGEHLSLHMALSPSDAPSRSRTCHPFNPFHLPLPFTELSSQPILPPPGCQSTTSSCQLRGLTSLWRVAWSSGRSKTDGRAALVFSGPDVTSCLHPSPHHVSVWQCYYYSFVFASACSLARKFLRSWRTARSSRTSSDPPGILPRR